MQSINHHDEDQVFCPWEDEDKVSQLGDSEEEKFKMFQLCSVMLASGKIMRKIKLMF